MSRFTSDNASVMGKRGGRASGETRKRLSLARVERELGPLETVEDAMRRLDRLGLWIAAGMLTGSAGSAAVRSIEVWLRGSEAKLTQRVVEQLAGEVKRLKAELQSQPLS